MDRRVLIRVLPAASLLLACLAIGVVASPRPADAADGETPGPTTIPVPPFVEITAGDQHACGLTGNGDVWCWWYGDHGQLGDGTTEGAYQAPVQVVDLPPAAAISAGGNSTCAVDRDGGLWCWGENDSGQLGDGSTENRSRPVRVTGLERGVLGVSMSESHACAVLEDHTARCWGENGDRQLGDGTDVSSSIPVRVTILAAPVESIAAGSYHTCAVAQQAGVWCWGDNWHGALGSGDTNSHDGAVQAVGLGGGARAIAAGYLVSCALRDDGAVLCWGDNTDVHQVSGQLGVGSSAEDVPVPQRITGLPDAIDIGTTDWADVHFAALTADGAVWGWGSNEGGAVGSANVPGLQGTSVRVIVGGVKEIAVGGDITAVLLDSGEVRWWGDGDPNPRTPFSGGIVVPASGYRPTGPLVPAITTNIPTPADISTDPPVVGANLLLAAIAMIAFTIAIELLNRTLADAEPLLRRRVGPLGRLDRARAGFDAAVLGRLGRIGHRRLADALRILGIAVFYGIVFALLDPTWDPLSVTGLWLVLSFAVACGLVGMSDDLASWVAARRWGVAGELSVRPGSLLAAVGSTVATRVFVLVPGVMVGAPEALEIDEEHLDRGRRGRLAAAGLGAVGIVGAVAWLVTLAAGPLRTAVPGIAVLVGGLEAFLLLVFAVAVQNGFVQLLAFRNSAGRALLHVNRIAWGFALLAVTFVFWHTLVNPRGDLSKALGATNVRAFLATVGIVLAVAAGAWVAVRIARRRVDLTPAAAGAVVAGAAAVPAAGAAAVPAAEATIPEAAPTLETPAVSAGPEAEAELPIVPEAAGLPDAVVAAPAVPVTPTVAAMAAMPPPTRVEAAGASVDEAMAAERLPTVVEAAAATMPAAVPAAPEAAGDARIPCPRCAEPIRPAARVCRFCGLELAPPAGPAGVASTTAVAPSVVATPVRPAHPVVAPAPAAAAGAPAVSFALRPSWPRRLGGPVRVVVAGDHLELHAGWVSRSVDRLVVGLRIGVIVALTVLAVPVLSAIFEPGFRFYRVPWLLPSIGGVVLGVGVGLVLLRVWHHRRRRFRQTSCPLGAVVRADTVVDANAASIATIVGLLVGGLLYVLVAGRTVVRVRAPLDPEHGSAVEIRLRAHDRDEASDIVRAILDARARAVPQEVGRP